MKEPVKKLLLVIPIRTQEDLLPVVESEGWHTVKDLYRKTSTSYNTHWNGNYVLDQDEIPWKATREELDSLQKLKGRVVVLSGTKYNISEKIACTQTQMAQSNVQEEDLEEFFGE